jgi:acyl-CoA synthetase (AMP-forming)/AMP-acid ligase II
VAGAICAGIPDPKWGTSPGCAGDFFTPVRAPAKMNSRRFCRDYLADYKLPRQIRPVTELPLTGAGKLNRHVVAAQFS